jgi:hypothetical protein
MTQDEIIEMAESCFIKSKNQIEFIELFAKLVAEHERNEIIEILDASTGYVHMDAIRERGQA